MDQILKKSAKDFMTKKILFVKSNSSIKEVFKLMDKNGILGIPVIHEDGGVIGIVTESDLIKHFTKLDNPKGINILGSILFLDNIEKFNESLKDHCAEIVSDIMTKDVITAMESTTLSEIIELMSTNDIGRIPVISEKGKLSGIITRTDVMHQLAKLKNI